MSGTLNIVNDIRDIYNETVILFHRKRKKDKFGAEAPCFFIQRPKNALTFGLMKYHISSTVITNVRRPAECRNRIM